MYTHDTKAPLFQIKKYQFLMHCLNIPFLQSQKFKWFRSSEGHNTKHSFIKIACISTHAKYNVLLFWSNDNPQMLMGTKVGWICTILALVDWHCQEVWNNTKVFSEQIILRSQNDQVKQHYHVKITCRFMQLWKTEY